MSVRNIGADKWCLLNVTLTNSDRYGLSLKSGLDKDDNSTLVCIFLDTVE